MPLNRPTLMTLAEVMDRLHFRTEAEGQFSGTSEIPAPALTGVGIGKAAGEEDETPIALFIGVNQRAYLFTSCRLLILKKTKPLARFMSGRMMTDFTSVLSSETVGELLAHAAVKEEIPLREVVWMDAERMYRVGALTVFARGRRYELTIEHKRTEIASYVERLRGHLQIPLSAAQVAMQRELKLWAWFYLATGSLTVLMSGVFPGMLDLVWGMVMTIIGAGVMLRRRAGMLLVLSLMMGWAGLTNLLGLNASMLNQNRLPLGVIFQLYWAGVLFTRYQRYAHLEVNDDTGSESASPDLLSPELILPFVIVIAQIATFIGCGLMIAKNILLMRALMHLAAVGATTGAVTWMLMPMKLMSSSRQFTQVAQRLRSIFMTRSAVIGATAINVLMTLGYIALLLTKQHS